MIKYSERYNDLNNCFDMKSNCKIKNSNIEIGMFDFNSTTLDKKDNLLWQYSDNNISENFSFRYPIFIPDKNKKYEKATLLLHGLNERSWNKYLTWAEYICANTDSPVILFPIAYHINRGPMEWSNPRKMMTSASNRKEIYNDDRSISYANIALSNRLSEHPSRFYLSGRQTLMDLTQLFETIKKGCHSIFKEGCDINIFSYSIGSFLSQIALMSNEKNLFSSSKLFMFCGGSIFSSMFGVSRSILDKASFTKLQNYYINEFGNETESIWNRDNIFTAFRQMISSNKYRSERENIFDKLHNRISGISLSKDIVIPYSGVKEAMGVINTLSSIQLHDFPFEYTHENPFPHNEKDTTKLNTSFEYIFSNAVSFLM